MKDFLVRLFKSDDVETTKLVKELDEITARERERAAKIRYMRETGDYVEALMIPPEYRRQNRLRRQEDAG